MRTERLTLRRLKQDDFMDLCEMLQDLNVVYSWGSTFTDEEVEQWIERQLKAYDANRAGIWAVIEKETGFMVGQIGLVVNSNFEYELDYMLKKSCWKRGFAVEGGKCCLDYAFKQMELKNVFATIRPENKAAIKVAEKLGATKFGECHKSFKGKDILYLTYKWDKI